MQLIVYKLLAGLIASGDYVAHGDGREALKRDLARTIFASARLDERDAASLKPLVRTFSGLGSTKTRVRVNLGSDPFAGLLLLICLEAMN